MTNRQSLEESLEERSRKLFDDLAEFQARYFGSDRPPRSPHRRSRRRNRRNLCHRRKRQR